jgi:hypothetical protein
MVEVAPAHSHWPHLTLTQCGREQRCDTREVRPSGARQIALSITDATARVNVQLTILCRSCGGEDDARSAPGGRDRSQVLKWITAIGVLGAV